MALRPYLDNIETPEAISDHRKRQQLKSFGLEKSPIQWYDLVATQNQHQRKGASIYEEYYHNVDHFAREEEQRAYAGGIL